MTATYINPADPLRVNIDGPSVDQIVKAASRSSDDIFTTGETTIDEPARPFRSPASRRRPARAVSIGQIEALSERVDAAAPLVVASLDQSVAAARETAVDVVGAAVEARHAFDLIKSDQAIEDQAFEAAVLADEPTPDRKDWQAETIRRRASLDREFAAAETAVSEFEAALAKVDKAALVAAAQSRQSEVGKARRVMQAAAEKAVQAASEHQRLMTEVDALANAGGLTRWTDGLGEAPDRVVHDLTEARLSISATEDGASWFEEVDGVPAATRRRLADSGREVDLFVLAHIEAVLPGSDYLAPHHREVLLVGSNGVGSTHLVQAFIASKGNVEAALDAHAKWASRDGQRLTSAAHHDLTGPTALPVADAEVTEDE